MKRKLALLTFALVAVAVAGFGFSTRSASAAPGLQANPGGPYAGVAGGAIQFDGSASFGFGLSYVWSFGDGTSAVGARPVKAYAAAGVYTVTLTVQDFTGARSVATTTASIAAPQVVGPGACYLTGAGTVVCGSILSGTIFAGVASGCYLTVAGWVCPTGLISSLVTSGAIVGPPAYPGSAPQLLNCAIPSHAATSVCRMLDRR